MTFLRIAAFLAALGLALPAAAQSLTFQMDNEFTRDVAVEFYSTDRDHIWPGGGQVWVLGVSDGAVRYALECRRGETICFGAWTQDQRDMWGVGMDMSQDCQYCCAACDGSVLDVIELN